MDELVKVKANNDFYDDVHYRRTTNQATTLCGLKIAGRPAHGGVTCLKCRQFAEGNF
jgi:hypothetical protein